MPTLKQEIKTIIENASINNSWGIAGTNNMVIDYDEVVSAIFLAIQAKLPKEDFVYAGDYEPKSVHKGYEICLEEITNILK